PYRRKDAWKRTCGAKITSVRKTVNRPQPSPAAHSMVRGMDANPRKFRGEAYPQLTPAPSFRSLPPVKIIHAVLRPFAGQTKPSRTYGEPLRLRSAWICAFNSFQRASRSAIFASQPTGFGV